MDKYEFFKGQYSYELERKDKLNSGLAFPISMLGVLVAAIGLCAPLVRSHPIHPAWIVAWSIGVVCMGMTAIYLIRAYHNFSYQFITPADELFKYQKELSDFYERISHEPGQVDREFENVVVEKFVNCASRNARNNDLKSWYLHRANRYLLIAGAAILIGGMPFLDALLESKETEVARVEIVDLEKILNRKEKKMANDKTPNQPSQTNKPATPSSAPQGQQQPQRPTIPSDRVIKEHSIPIKPGSIEKK